MAVSAVHTLREKNGRTYGGAPTRVNPVAGFALYLARAG